MRNDATKNSNNLHLNLLLPLSIINHNIKPKSFNTRPNSYNTGLQSYNTGSSFKPKMQPNLTLFIITQHKNKNYIFSTLFITATHVTLIPPCILIDTTILHINRAYCIHIKIHIIC